MMNENEWNDLGEDNNDMRKKRKTRGEEILDSSHSLTQSAKFVFSSLSEPPPSLLGNVLKYIMLDTHLEVTL